VILGLILIIIGLLPVIATFVTIPGIDQILPYLGMLGIYSMTIGDYVFTETMLALVALGLVLMIAGAVT